MLKALFVFGALATLSVSAQSQTVFRCVIDGRTTFSQVPCAPDADRVSATPALSTSRPATLNPIVTQEQIQRRQLDLQLEQQQRQREFDRQVAQRERDYERRRQEISKEIDCGSTTRRRESAERLADRYVMPENIRRAKNDARELRQREFMDDCK